MFRVAVVNKNGEIKANNLPTKRKCEEWLLNYIDRNGEPKVAMILDKENIKDKEIIRFGGDKK